MTDERKTVTLPLVWNETSDVAWLLAGNAPVGGVAQSGMADTFGQFYWWLKNDTSRLRYCPTREKARAALEAAVLAMGVASDDAADALRTALAAVEAGAADLGNLMRLRTLAAELAGALNTVVNAYEGQTCGTPYEMTRALPDARAALGNARAAGLVP